jgi:hypothetical protein
MITARCRCLKCVKGNSDSAGWVDRPLINRITPFTASPQHAPPFPKFVRLSDDDDIDERCRSSTLLGQCLHMPLNRQTSSPSKRTIFSSSSKRARTIGGKSRRRLMATTMDHSALCPRTTSNKYPLNKPTAVDVDCSDIEYADVVRLYRPDGGGVVVFG